MVFWDEFDSKKYKWLQYLLAPMQEGRFQQGQVTHSLGHCVFIFAGATSSTFKDFGPGNTPESIQQFKLKKGPDFKSRLDGYLNVVGPNRRRLALPQGASARERAAAESVSGHYFVEDLGDLCFPISRALMIRSKLGCARDEKLDVDEGLVRALLRVDKYEHGARSLDKILQPLIAARPGRLLRSLIPARGQLEMQADADDFLAECDEERTTHPPPKLDEAYASIMAPAIHDVWREVSRKEGWLKEEMDADLEELPQSFERHKKPIWLGKFLRQSNYEAARRMPGILERVGLRLSESNAAGSAEDEKAVRGHLEHHLEFLADAEHNGWMQWRPGGLASCGKEGQ